MPWRGETPWEHRAISGLNRPGLVTDTLVDESPEDGKVSTLLETVLLLSPLGSFTFSLKVGEPRSPTSPGGTRHLAGLAWRWREPLVMLACTLVRWKGGPRAQNASGCGVGGGLEEQSCVGGGSLLASSSGTEWRGTCWVAPCFFACEDYGGGGPRPGSLRWAPGEGGPIVGGRSETLSFA